VYSLLTLRAKNCGGKSQNKIYIYLFILPSRKNEKTGNLLKIYKYYNVLNDPVLSKSPIKELVKTHK
jgi:hypothetical protein